MCSFFRNVDTRHSPSLEIPTGTGNSPIRSLKARAVLIDMEEGVIKQLISGHLGDLFDTKQYITGNSGSGNNWAQGHEVYGPEYADDILEKIRKQVELCDSLQSFVMLHSLGGGTGSGVGSYIVELLHDAYPQVYQFSTSIFPSVDDDVVTSPYNSQKENTRGKHSIAKGKVKGDKPFDSMNGIAANLLLHLTSSMRFEGSLNVDLNEITTNLVPYPKLHFLVSSMAPHSAFSHSGSAAQQHRAINQLFTEVFMRDNQLIKVDPTRSTYLACALLMRGNGCTISDLHQNVARIKHRLTMVSLPHATKSFRGSLLCGT
ncbi:hypothetical protein BDL97_06G066700 [Sphagnum fallax]|nr:hypothetical protein BDL97_06G066700 [Sphagnum fallax]KAH8959183.1 hypothetical protein BDL97_06G066700 [Sphagnum fallax]